MKNLKEKGITLVSLVVTIILLLILAGVTIGAISGNNGLFTRVREAVEKYKNSSLEEEEQLSKIDDQLNGMDYGNDNNNSGESKSSVEYYKVGEDLIPIPKGFCYVGGTKESGVVISDNLADKERYKGEEEVPSGAESEAYDANGKIIEEKLTIKGNQFVFIPCNVEDYKKIDFGDGLESDKTTNSGELQQIYKYGGFYVGRFEAGTSNVKINSGLQWEAGSIGGQNENYTIDKVTGTITEKPGEIPYYHSNYLTAYGMSEGMYKDNEYVYSGLVTGTMWDSIMQFISTTEDYSDLKNTPWGNYYNLSFNSLKGRSLSVNTNRAISAAVVANKKNANTMAILTTASTDEFRKKNIYDIAGNQCEWTQEVCWRSSDMGTYTVRGGHYYYFYTNVSAAACLRGVSTANTTSCYCGFRPALFIK